MLAAKWIWSNRDKVNDYNQTAVFIKEFELKEWKNAKLAITADSWYRLKVNGEWLNDGPCRNYPNHYQYDEIDVSGSLRCGLNRIEVLARYFGSGTAHQIPQQAGMLAQLEIDSQTALATDRSWLAADFPNLIPNVPHFSIKQEAAELYDARIPLGGLLPACELFDWDKGPWSGLHLRDCRLMTRNEFNLRRFAGAGKITSQIWNLSIPAQCLLHPGQTTSNFSNSLGCGAAFNVESERDCGYEFFAENLDIFINGEHLNPVPTLLHRCKGRFKKGLNFLLVLTKYPFENQQDLCITIINPDGLKITNPTDVASRDICFLQFPEFHYESCEIPYHMWANKELHRRQKEAMEYFAFLGRKITDCAGLVKLAGKHLIQLGREKFSNDEAHWEFCARELAPLSPGDVIDPQNLLYDTCEYTTVNPAADGCAVELQYDFGEQNCGYWDFVLNADAGTVIDMFAVEYVNEKGKVQHTDDVRNGFRYICHGGLNKYTSLRRRSGRYLFITLRNLTGPVKIKYVRLLASTYPVNREGTFLCSDGNLNRIWDISARTVKLCMEDVFTDCPCYEQSLWTGDTRNIALFSYSLYAPWDLGRRCIRLGGYSLDKYPIVGSQIPSGWDCLIPSFSFLWGLSVWDYYEETGDVDFIREVFPYVRRNIDGAWANLDPENGLFTMYAWNLFEWTETDNYQPRMLYDSMTLSMAVRVGLNCAYLIGDIEAAKELSDRLHELNAAINRTWRNDLGGYPDSIRCDTDDVDYDLPKNLVPVTYRDRVPGPCNDVSVHTSMLSILFDIIDEGHLGEAAENVLNPRPELIRIKNVFARLYLYQCLEKLGRSSEIVGRLRDDYAPMLTRDSTTTWENFSGIIRKREFPCRSHSHAWSAGSIYFFHRMILGLKMTRPGAGEFELSPELGDLTYAEGIRATVKGPLLVRWRKDNGELHITTETPAGVDLKYKANESHNALRVFWNGHPVKL